MPVGPVAVIPVRDGVLPAGALDVAAEMADASADSVVVVVGSGSREAAAGLAGTVARAEAAELGDVAVGRWSAALAARFAEAPFLLLPGSPDGRDLAARLAARLGWPLVANALVVAPDRIVAVHHGGRLQSELVPDGPFVATLQPGVRGVAATDAPIEVVERHVDLEPGVADAAVVGVDPPEAATMDLGDASRIVGGGAGLMGGPDPASRFAGLSAVGAALGASMGATRVVTDAGFVHHDRQIGTTGVVVDPDLYLAFGISGAVQHTAGLGAPHHVISVNTDPHCPMMALADLAVVADAPAVLEELARRLEVAP